MPRPFLLDTDAGVDDALAIILALRSPEISVRAITTVAGNVEVGKCTRNVNYLVDLLQPPRRPEIAQGAAKPLKRALVTAPEVHGKDGLGGVAPQGSPSLPVAKNAVDVILERCALAEKKLTIVALGPLTNLALAWKKKPQVLRKVGKIVSMGGAFRVHGNTGPVAEFNYYVDPDAAHIVLNSGLPVTVIPLDVTEQVVLMRKEVEYRAKRRASTVARFILSGTRHYMQYHRQTEGFSGGYLHDPIAVAAAVWPSIIETKKASVDVETQGELTRGMSVAEFRRHSSQRKPTVHLATRIDREIFLRLFHERLWK
ncbi:MAG: nucleoside hydrolase [Ignavibacteriales bacterium]|nr:nucleoside hydrolase [Ignavibacteriales bacterium]